jgi:hypothetical protein
VTPLGRWEVAAKVPEIHLDETSGVEGDVKTPQAQAHSRRDLRSWYRLGSWAYGIRTSLLKLMGVR